MGWSNATATTEKAKFEHASLTKTKKFLPVEDKHNEEEKPDDWWERIKKDHEEKKKNNIIMDPGWANPFEQKPVIPKKEIIQRPKIEEMKIVKQSNSSG